MFVNHSLQSALRAAPFASGRLPGVTRITAPSDQELLFPSQDPNGRWRAPSPKIQTRYYSVFLSRFDDRFCDTDSATRRPRKQAPMSHRPAAPARAADASRREPRRTRREPPPSCRRGAHAVPLSVPFRARWIRRAERRGVPAAQAVSPLWRFLHGLRAARAERTAAHFSQLMGAGHIRTDLPTPLGTSVRKPHSGRFRNDQPGANGTIREAHGWCQNRSRTARSSFTAQG